MEENVKKRNNNSTSDLERLSLILAKGNNEYSNTKKRTNTWSNPKKKSPWEPLDLRNQILVSGSYGV
jgi:hypothetical protein